MKRSPTLCFYVLPLALLLAASSCQSVQTALTGQVFKKAPETSPRVEAEVMVLIRDDFFGDLADRADADALRADAVDLILSRADLGLRFYPVASSEYSAVDSRPEYALTVELEELRVLVETKTFKSKEFGKVLRDVVSGVECRTSVSVEKRRSDRRPPLLVGTSIGTESGRANQDPEDLAVELTYALRRDSDQEPLAVLREDLMRAIDEAIIEALREVIPPVDRDLNVPDEK